MGDPVDQLSRVPKLLRRPAPALDPLRHPPAPTHPDQVWHIDLMYLGAGPDWYYLVDILDGYSRFIVHWWPTPNPTGG